MSLVSEQKVFPCIGKYPRDGLRDNDTKQSLVLFTDDSSGVCLRGEHGNRFGEENQSWCSGNFDVILVLKQDES